MADDSIEKAITAVNDASGQVSAVWVTLLSLGTYLAIAIGSTTHVDLLLENPITLPLLGIELGLFTFYWAAPVLFLIFHLYFLIQLYILAGKVHSFNALIAQGTVRSDRERLRGRLHVFMLTQALGGPRRGVVPSLLLRLTLWITAVLAPVALLVLAQLRFLPYHDEVMTWWHRTAVILDLLILWLLWPLILHPSGAMKPFLRDLFARPLALPGRAYVAATEITPTIRQIIRRDPNRWIAILELWRWQRHLNRETKDALRAVTAALYMFSCSILVFVFVVIVATIPNEFVETWMLELAFVKDSSFVVMHSRRKMLGLTATLFEGDVDDTSKTPASWLTRNLVLIDRDLVDNTIYKGRSPSLSLRSRQLRNAIFDRSDLHDANFTSAQLRDASFSGTHLEGASFSAAHLERASLFRAHLERASFSDTHLEGAFLDFAYLQGAHLGKAYLQEASLDSAELQGADLTSASLQGASLKSADLLGASLVSANLQVAALGSAHLEGASLARARLQGASFTNAHLQGASLVSAKVEGASLQLAELQGIDTSGAAFRFVDLRGAGAHPLSDRAAAALIRRIESSISDRDTRMATLDRLSEVLKRPQQPWKPVPLVDNSYVLIKSDKSEISRDWVGHGADPTAFWQGKADRLNLIACGDGWVARALAAQVTNFRYDNGDKKLITLGLLAPTCEGAKQLSDETRTALGQLISPGSLPSSTTPAPK